MCNVENIYILDLSIPRFSILANLIKSFLLRMESKFQEKVDMNCKICDIEVDSEHLENHFQIFHNGRMPFNCPICQKGFPIEDLLKEHLISVDCEEIDITDVLDFETRNSNSSGHKENKINEVIMVSNSEEENGLEENLQICNSDDNEPTQLLNVPLNVIHIEDHQAHTAKRQN